MALETMGREEAGAEKDSGMGEKQRQAAANRHTGRERQSGDEVRRRQAKKAKQREAERGR